MIQTQFISHYFVFFGDLGGGYAGLEMWTMWDGIVWLWDKPKTI